MAGAMMSAAPLMHDHAIHGFVSVPARIINRDRVSGAQRVVINRRTVIIDERNISAVAVTHRLIADTETDEV